MEAKENFLTLIGDLSKFAIESAAVTDVDEKKESIISILSSLNNSLSNRASLSYLLSEDEEIIANILFILQVYVSQNIRMQAVSLLSKLCCGPGQEKSLTNIVQAGGTRIILQALRVEFSEKIANEELMINIHKLLCKLSPFDRRFSLRARLSQCIPITISLLRSQVAHLQSFMGPRALLRPPPKTSSTTAVTNNSHGGRRHRRLSASTAPATSAATTSAKTFRRLPTSLANNLRVLFSTVRAFCARKGRSNAATLGRLGAVNLLLKSIAVITGIAMPPSRVAPRQPRGEGSISEGEEGEGEGDGGGGGGGGEDGASDSGPEAVGKARLAPMASKTGGGGVGGGGKGSSMLVNAPTVAQMLSTLVVLMKWRHNVTRATCAGGGPLLLELFLAVHRSDEEVGRMLDLQLLSLTSLQLIMDLRAGRRSLVASGGFFSLFSLCAAKMAALRASQMKSRLPDFLEVPNNSLSPAHTTSAPSPPTTTSSTPSSSSDQRVSSPGSSTVSLASSMRETSSTPTMTTNGVDLDPDRDDEVVEGGNPEEDEEEEEERYQYLQPQRRGPGRDKTEKLVRHKDTVLTGLCDLLRRCCPYQTLPVHPPEPILKVVFNSGDDKSLSCSKLATLKLPSIGEEGENVNTTVPNSTHNQQNRPRRSKSCQLVTLNDNNKNARSHGPNRVSVEVSKPHTGGGNARGKKLLRKRSKTTSKIEVVEATKVEVNERDGGGATAESPKNLTSPSAATKSQRGDLLPGVTCSSAEAHLRARSSSTLPHQDPTLGAAHLEGLLSAVEIRHASSAGDLHGTVDTNASSNTGALSARSASRPRSKSLQKSHRHTRHHPPPPPPTSPKKLPRKRSQSLKPRSVTTAPPAKSRTRTVEFGLAEDDEDDAEDDEDDEIVCAEAADLADDENAENNEGEEDDVAGDSSSACGSPVKRRRPSKASVGEPEEEEEEEVIEDLLMHPSAFGLQELLESHGRFFMEWRDVPGLVPRETVEALETRERKPRENEADEVYEAMISASLEATSPSSRYLIAARNVHSALDYALHQNERLVAYPDLIGAGGPDFREPLHSPLRPPAPQELVPPGGPLRVDSADNQPDITNKWTSTIPLSLDDVRRLVDPEDTIGRVVFNLDDLILQERNAEPHSGTLLNNSDELLVDKFDPELGHLEFESRFESGNLRKVIQVRQTEYDLLLSPDLNTRTHLQWFYFRLANIDNSARYRFNIINLEKTGSQFNGGMQPVVFSVKEAMNGRPYWYRAGSCIKYYKNHFVRGGNGGAAGGGVTSSIANAINPRASRNYYTATFTLQFQHRGDVCYVAYHYPYTHSRLLADLNHWQLRARTTAGTTTNAVVSSSATPTGGGRLFKSGRGGNSRMYFRVQNLTNTLLDNPVPVITITEVEEGQKQMNDSKRPYIVITARVHPGESNSSWVMRGLLDRLTDPNDLEMARLRKIYVFKIVPSLNPDGVICGNHRCSMAAKDLNRQWLNPSQTLHPTIFHTKCLINLLSEIGNAPFIYIDLHGHSRMKDTFVYGCDPHLSWRPCDANMTQSGMSTLVDNGNGETNAMVDASTHESSFLELAEVMHEISPPFSKTASEYSIVRMKEATGRVVVWRQFKVSRSYTLESSYCGTTRNCWQGKANTEVAHSEGHQISPWILQSVGMALCNAFLLLNPYSSTSSIWKLN